MLYLKQQSGLYKGVETTPKALTVTKADTSILPGSRSSGNLQLIGYKVENGTVKITGKKGSIKWTDSQGNTHTNWDNYSQNEKVITPIIDGNYQGHEFYPNNDGSFYTEFVPSKNKSGHKPMYLKFSSTTLFNTCQNEPVLIDLNK